MERLEYAYYHLSEPLYGRELCIELSMPGEPWPLKPRHNILHETCVARAYLGMNCTQFLSSLISQCRIRLVCPGDHGH